MKQRPTFKNQLKEKLSDFRTGMLSLDEIIIWLNKYYSNKKIK